jgi:hypothetical protein
MRFLRMQLARGLDTAQRPAKVVEFPFIRQFLALGNLNQLQNLVDPVNQFAQTFGNLGGMNHGLMNCGSVGGTKIGGFNPRFWRRGIRPALMSGLVRLLVTGRRRGFRGGWKRGLTLSTASGGSRMRRLGKFGRRFGSHAGFGGRLGGIGNFAGSRRLD